jgi:hypothetical protein
MTAASEGYNNFLTEPKPQYLKRGEEKVTTNYKEHSINQ